LLFFYLSIIPDPQQKADFEQVYRNYHKACIFVALKHTGGNQMLAEDAVHNAFTKILEKYPDYLEDSCNKLKSQIVIIVRHEAIDLMRKEIRRDHDELFEEEVTEDVGEDVSLSAILEGAEGYSQIKNCIDKLNDNYKTVFTLRYQYDYSLEEIAELLQITETNVSVRLHRAKKQLRELLKKAGKRHG
jgi:RNA polymerase sigma-70 factor (ECF subfamily)